MTEMEMKQRTKEFALRVLRMADAMPRSPKGAVITRQIVRSGTSVAANYRAVCRAKSAADFAFKLSVVEEEADETALWLELIIEDQLLRAEKVTPLLQEANAITAMMVSSQITVRGRGRSAVPKSKIPNPKSAIEHESE
jgi:four helix bundle protein